MAALDSMRRRNPFRAIAVLLLYKMGKWRPIAFCPSFRHFSFLSGNRYKFPYHNNFCTIFSPATNEEKARSILQYGALLGRWEWCKQANPAAILFYFLNQQVEPLAYIFLIELADKKNHECASQKVLVQVSGFFCFSLFI